MHYEAFKPPIESSSPNVAKTPISDDELQLRKRARRRLVGAVVLVLLVVVFVPMFLDREPRQQKQDMDIQIPPIPGQPQAPPASSAAPPPAAAQSAAPPESSASTPASSPAPGPAVEAAAPQPSAPPKTAEPPAPVAAVAEAPATAPSRPVEARSEAKPVAPGEVYVIRLGAFADSSRAKELLARVKAEKLPGYTEAVKTQQGVRTRVRAGPFASMQEAERAKGELKRAKLLPGSDAKIVRKGE